MGSTMYTTGSTIHAVGNPMRNTMQSMGLLMGFFERIRMRSGRGKLHAPPKTKTAVNTTNTEYRRCSMCRLR